MPGGNIFWKIFPPGGEDFAGGIFTFTPVVYKQAQCAGIIECESSATTLKGVVSKKYQWALINHFNSMAMTRDATESSTLTKQNNDSSSAILSPRPSHYHPLAKCLLTFHLAKP